ncbi:amidase family protein [Portibacter marinus]|uniref:amidase family protein n=1 Tax=Portibacter marinus TaxID=2898660 RepID=UPI001EEE22C0|nr:amidase family protein [Portibacter marinus]
MKLVYSFLTILFVLSCQSSRKITASYPEYDEAKIIAKNADHENSRMRYKLVQSKVLDKKALQKNILKQIKDFNEQDYVRLKPYIFEQDIPSIQSSIEKGSLTYKTLVQWYLYRINKYEFDPNTSLHTIISINENAVEEAVKKDENTTESHHPIFGMPILLKDNINTAGMKTTAGAVALAENETDDAFIVERLKEKGAIILGKVNLSEWAYFFCSGCPVGYSAVGGQTLNPYGRTVFETGGSSAGSGTSMAANYAVGAVGTETSGSILSPSSKNSVVGLKPTVGLLSRSGIVPISSTLDTPGPMTRNVTDNAILLSAMVGKDNADPWTRISMEMKDYSSDLDAFPLEGLRLGANKKYMDEVPLYAEMMVGLTKRGVEIYGFDPKDVQLDGFLSILNIDMKKDLPAYLETYAGEKVKIRNIADVIAFNEKDMEIRAPYGQQLFEGILQDTVTLEQLVEIIDNGRKNARSYFDEPIDAFNLDVVASVNNYDAGRAALAHYPALTIPMGFTDEGEPMNLTLIGTTLSEEALLQIGYAIESAVPMRRPPDNME